MLSGENGVRRCLRRKFAADFELAREILALGYCVHDTLSMKNSGKFSELTKATCVGVYTKLCKQYHSICALCELGLTDDANILVRSMFESLLVVLFLLRQKVVFKHGNRKPPKDRLSVDFRAALYAAKQALNCQKISQAWLETPGLKRDGKKLKQRGDEQVAEARRVIGSDWIGWLKKGNMFGLSVEVMAKNLGLCKWYQSIYRLQSSGVHAADALHHLECDESMKMITPKLEPNCDSTTGPIHIATEWFVLATDLINRRFGLGHDEEIRSIMNRSRTLRRND